MNSLDWLKQLHQVCSFQTKEGTLVGPASNSELKRWIVNGVVEVNGRRLKLSDAIDINSITSVILFPNNKKAKITIW